MFSREEGKGRGRQEEAGSRAHLSARPWERPPVDVIRRPAHGRKETENLPSLGFRKDPAEPFHFLKY